MSALTLMPREDIKKAILHRELEIRRMAIEYLSDLHSSDTEIMPLLIRAVEQYGRENALLSLYHAQDLAQTPDTLEWAVRELEKSESFDRSFRGSYVIHLAELIFHAPIELIRLLKDRILKAPFSDKDLREKIALLFEYEKKDFDTLWARLEGLCRKHVSDNSFKEDEPVYDALIGSLIRFGERTAESVRRVIPLDTLKIESAGGDPDWWMEIAAIELAGALRLEDAAGAILNKFDEEYDFRSDLCCRALARIDSDKTVELICQRFRAAPEVSRGYVAETLGNIRSARSARACLDLVDQEPALYVRTQLLSSLLFQFTHEGMDKVYAVVKHGKWDSKFCDLKEDFAWACVMMGEKYPESGAWEKYASTKHSEREKKMREAFPEFMSLLDKEGSPKLNPEAKPSLTGDPRAVEKTMFDLTRQLREKKPKTVQDLKSTLQGLMGKMIPALAPKDSLEAAQELAYKAFGTEDKAEKIKLAKEALKLSENCADACVILGEETDDLDEEIRLYRQGVEAGERSLGEEFFRENRGRFWGIFETRPYMRARFALAGALGADGKTKEALEHLRELLKLNPNDNQGARYLLANCLLEIRKYDELLELTEKQYSEDASSEWRYTKALLYYEFYGDGDSTRACLQKAIQSNQYIPDYLLGLKKIPELKSRAVGFGSEEEAVYYCRQNGPLWWRNSKVIQWLKRQVYPSEPQRREGEKLDNCWIRRGQIG